MTNLMVQALSVLIMVLFGAMAYYPLFVRSDAADARPGLNMEDRVVSVAFGKPTELTEGGGAQIDRFPSCPVDGGASYPDERPAA